MSLNLMNINRMVQAAAIALPVLLMTSCLGSDDVLEPSRLNMVTSCEFGADVVAYTTAMVRDADGQLIARCMATGFQTDVPLPE